MSITYLRSEIVRMFRSPRFVVFAVAFPILMFLLQSNVFISKTDKDHTAVVIVLMINMMVFGGFGAAMSNSTKLAYERSTGWQRQLRLTPLSGTGYLSGKAVSALLVGLPAMILVPAAAWLTQGIEFDLAKWATLIAVSWATMIPFIFLGLLLGQFGTVDSMQPVNMLIMMGMGFLGGLWIPVQSVSWLHTTAQFLPSYGAVQLGYHVAGAGADGSMGGALLLLGAWTVVLGALVIRRYRKDGARV
ncbi:ABC transporter permease [Amycolatopsis sp. cg5]|uniref:ABC transporter permease n=1 Tax=Amycolatopsis sp. cg5 TaxID=3238802 RepID=UPI00352346FB